MPAHSDPIADPADDTGLPVLHRLWVLMPLLAPFGISIGFIGVTLGFQLQAAGMAIGLVTAIVAAAIGTQSLKFLWAPLVDTLLTPRLWYAIGLVLVITTMIITCILPRTNAMVPFYMLLAVASAVGSSLTSMAAEVIMTRCVHPSRRGTASGWSQAGNVGGTSIGGGLGLAVAQHVASPVMPALVLGVICLGCMACLWLVPRIVRGNERLAYAARLTEVGRDVITVVRTRTGMLALVLMLLPIASGEAPFQLIGAQWQVGGDMIALFSGTLGGLTSVVGALIGGYLTDRLGPRTTYIGAGLASGLVATAMALAPHTPIAFLVGVLSYSVLIGGGYAAYSAVVLEAIGRRSAATNFNLMSAMSNVPLAAMTAFDGWMVDAHGTSAMLFGELWLQALAAAGFGLFVLATRPRAVPRTAPA
ncbi:MFS transporter [Novosphingobium sp.]|uniref:MFS transporter n=1 Tax=Novosphingobium sp. TaxID=1874826 RepID=UPI0033402581